MLGGCKVKLLTGFCVTAVKGKQKEVPGAADHWIPQGKDSHLLSGH